MDFLHARDIWFPGLAGLAGSASRDLGRNANPVQCYGQLGVELLDL
jgi:hypothetical protein